ncbi:MAG TPA: carbohydrate ABC transporter permease [Rectinemataceae bacterium]|nr:carbohydrate ABC transporter permease [Rectinemataceae bacterium]
MVKRTSPIRSAAFGIGMVMLLIFTLFPFAQMLSTSLKFQWDWGNPSLIPRKVNTGAYAEILGLNKSEKALPQSIRDLLAANPDLTKEQKAAIIAKFQKGGDVFPFSEYFLNSLIISVLSSAVSVALGIFGAYAFSRTRFRGRSLVQRGTLFVYMFGGTLLLLPMYKMAVTLGFMKTAGGSLLGLGIVYLAQTLPVALYMLGNYFRTIPFSIEEAAMIDGCSRMQALMRIVLPLSIAAIATVFIYAFMIAWNEYLFASVFLRAFKDSYTLTIGLKSLFVSKNAIWDRIMAASMLTALPVIFMFMPIQRQFSSGMAEGGVKE